MFLSLRREGSIPESKWTFYMKVIIYYKVVHEVPKSQKEE